MSDRTHADERGGRPALWTLGLAAAAAGASAAGGAEPRLTPVPFTDVRIEDDFWRARLETNRTVTLPYCFRKCEETGRIGNFAPGGGLEDGPFEGIYFNDSDVYKVIEGASYALASRPDPALDAYLDGVIAKIAAAQQPDGYLNTYYTLVAPAERWTDLAKMHELYCAGHLLEAAVAHHRATGKRTLLDVAVRLADHIDGVFGPDGRHDVPGHQEIEIGLVKLYHATGERRYLVLAEFFLDQRGRGEGRELYGSYCQDHAPVTAQGVPTGHAVRAMYLYCGMADVAAQTGNAAYLDALDRLWGNTVGAKLYLTGGVGARQHGEAFGDDYELPNASAYAETCAAIGNALWNHRLNLLYGDARYADVVERVIYNGALSGVSLAGDRFFYPNPLASHGNYHRSPWFACSCCPVNIVRFVPSIAGYVAATGRDGLYVNLYVAGTVDATVAGTAVTLRMRTDYPWAGAVEIVVAPEGPAEFDLALRIPGWATGAPVPSDLYTDVDRPDTGHAAFTVRVNGEPVAARGLDRGYLRLRRRWTAGDTVALDLPMPVRRVRAHERVEANRGRIAIERGPIVYCVERADTDGHVRHLWLPEDPALVAEHRPDLLGGVTVVRGVARARVRPAPDATPETRTVPFMAVPYHAWDHRAAGEMTVWLPVDPAHATIVPAPTVASTSRASASHCFEHDTVAALNDQVEPTASDDHAAPRFTWWDHLGTTEWVQYEFDGPRRVSRSEIYWFDDTGIGRCRRPAGWRLLRRTADGWQPVGGARAAPIARDAYDRLDFPPVETTALRLEVQLQPEFSGGILEWRVE